MKRLLLTLLILVGLSARAADITQGHVFTPGEQNITHVEMNEIVGSATINTAFFTAKSAATPSAADVILFYSTGSAGFRKATLQTALYDQTALITSQTEDSTPAPGDFVLTYDTSAGLFKKVSLQNLSTGSTNAIASYPTITTPTLADFVPVSQSSTNAKTTSSNLLNLFNYKTPFTNLTAHTAPTNIDKLLIWDSLAGANKTTTLIGLVTNEPFVVAPQTNARVLMVDSTSNVVQTTLTNIGRTLIKGFIFPGAFGAGASADTAHGFPTVGPNLGFPQVITCTIQCNTAELGYSVGDNVNADSVLWDLGGTNRIMYGFNGTNVFFRCPTNLSNFPRLLNKTNSVWQQMDTNNWQTTIQAIYFNFKTVP